jgi:hypothetical protein
MGLDHPPTGGCGSAEQGSRAGLDAAGDWCHQLARPWDDRWIFFSGVFLLVFRRQDDIDIVIWYINRYIYIIYICRMIFFWGIWALVHTCSTCFQEIFKYRVFKIMFWYLFGSEIVINLTKMIFLKERTRQRCDRMPRTGNSKRSLEGTRLYRDPKSE